MKLQYKALRILAVGSLVALSASAVAAATSASSGPKFWACSTKSHQLTVMTNGRCAPGTHKVTIGARGPAGAQGAQGMQGIQGVPGVPGIAGPKGATGAIGAAGVAGTTLYHQTIATAGASSTSPTTVTLATVGPFTITGECFAATSTLTEAKTVVTTSQDHSAFDDYDTTNTPNWLAGVPQQVGYTQTGMPGTPAFTGANDGTAAMESGDGATFMTLLAGDGVYVGSGGGATEPACTFFGTFAHN